MGLHHHPRYRHSTDRAVNLPIAVAAFNGLSSLGVQQYHDLSTTRESSSSVGWDWDCQGRHTVRMAVKDCVNRPCGVGFVVYEAQVVWVVRFVLTGHRTKSTGRQRRYGFSEGLSEVMRLMY